MLSVSNHDMAPAQAVRALLERFNAADFEGLAALYAPDAIKS